MISLKTLSLLLTLLPAILSTPLTPLLSTRQIQYPTPEEYRAAMCEAVGSADFSAIPAGAVLEAMEQWRQMTMESWQCEAPAINNKSSPSPKDKKKVFARQVQAPTPEEVQAAVCTAVRSADFSAIPAGVVLDALIEAQGLVEEGLQCAAEGGGGDGGEGGTARKRGQSTFRGPLATVLGQFCASFERNPKEVPEEDVRDAFVMMQRMVGDAVGCVHVGV